MRACNRCGAWSRYPSPSAIGPICERCADHYAKERQAYAQRNRHMERQHPTDDQIEAANYAEAMSLTSNLDQ